MGSASAVRPWAIRDSPNREFADKSWMGLDRPEPAGGVDVLEPSKAQSKTQSANFLVREIKAEETNFSSGS